MAWVTYKLEFGGPAPNIPHVLNLLTNLLGTGNFNYNYQSVPPRYFTVNYDSRFANETQIDQCLNEHDPLAQVVTPIIMGGGTGAITPAGVNSNLSSASLRGALAASADSTPVLDLRVGTGDPLDPTNPFTGTWIVYPAVEYPAGSGKSYTWMEISANIVTTGANATLAQLIAGAGAVTLDADGLTLSAPITAAGSINELKWKTDDDATLIGEMYSFYTGSGSDKSSFIYLISAAKSGGSNTFGELHLIAEGPAGFTNSTRIDLTSNPGNPMLGYKDSFNNSGSLHYGDYATYQLSGASLTTIYTRTIKGSSLGGTGMLRVRVYADLSNASGAGRTVTFYVNWGGATRFQWTTGSVTNGQDGTYIFDFYLQNASASAQRMSLDYSVLTTAGTSSTPANVSAHQIGFNAATANTASDQTFSIQTQISGTGANLYTMVDMIGPYYQA